MSLQQLSAVPPAVQAMEPAQLPPPIVMQPAQVPQPIVLQPAQVPPQAMPAPPPQMEPEQYVPETYFRMMLRKLRFVPKITDSCEKGIFDQSDNFIKSSVENAMSCDGCIPKVLDDARSFMAKMDDEGKSCVNYATSIQPAIVAFKNVLVPDNDQAITNVLALIYS